MQHIRCRVLSTTNPKAHFEGHRMQVLELMLVDVFTANQSKNIDNFKANIILIALIYQLYWKKLWYVIYF